jgi:Ca-activated chloride channel family protein
MDMEWLEPLALLGLWGLPLLVGLRWWAGHAGERGRRAFLGAVMEARLAPVTSRWRRHLKTTLVTVAVAAMILALARPRWGVYYEDVEARGVDLYVLVDTSRSMLAEDVQPSRLERARQDIRDFVDRVRGDRVGLIAFAGAAVIKCPLTLDYGFFDLALADLDVTSAPLGGTMIGDAIRVAIRAFGKETSSRERLILLLTDGEDQDSYPREAALRAAEQGIRIIAVGLGDPGQGSLVPAGDGTYLTHDGEHVRSRLDLTTLEEVAQVSGGIFVPAGTRHHDLGAIYEDHVADLVGEEATGQKRRRRHERFQWFTALALIALVADMLVGRFPRGPAVLLPREGPAS